ncbi:MAG: alpha/beta hydrolase [Proteobacteria bacterium]|jgi:acetyl esterase|nr:alpha/beta hydrolase [Pseudomonadota bacterium]
MLHPQTRALIDFMVERQIPPTHTLAPPEARRLYLERRGFTQPDAPEVAEAREWTASGPAGDIPLRAYRPLGAAPEAVLPVLVYYHGGGWVIGDLDTHDTLCRELANGAGCAVVAVHYRLAPEQPFPAAFDDALAATRWVAEHAIELRIDPARLAVGGDSAGGNLAAAVALAARDDSDGRGPLAIAYQLLIYPAVDMRRGHESHQRNGQGYVLTQDTIAYFANHYLPDAAQGTDWRASPLLAASHARLPPALVLTAGYDPLVDEGLDYARALSEAGNRVSYVSFGRQIHGFIPMGKVLDEARTAVTLCAAELRRALAR